MDLRFITKKIMQGAFRVVGVLVNALRLVAQNLVSSASRAGTMKKDLLYSKVMPVIAEA